MDINDHVETIREFCILAGQNAPNEMTIPSESERILRAKLALEEALELCTALGVRIGVDHPDPVTIDHIDFSIDPDREFDFNGVADAAADIFWVSCGGVAALCGFDFGRVLEEVDRSNMSKFIDGHRREDGKWQKGPSYSPADIESVLEDIDPRSDYYFRIHKTDNEDFPKVSFVEKDFWDEWVCLDPYSPELGDIKIKGLKEVSQNLFEPRKPMSEVKLANLLDEMGFDEAPCFTKEQLSR